MGRICRQTLSQAYEKTECRCCRRRVKAGGNAKDGYDIREALGRPVCLFVRTRRYSLANGQGNGYNNGMDMQRILSPLRRAAEDHSMFADGDRVAVGLSGGMDPSVLLAALVHALTSRA